MQASQLGPVMLGILVIGCIAHCAQHDYDSRCRVVMKNQSTLGHQYRTETNRPGLNNKDEPQGKDFSVSSSSTTAVSGASEILQSRILELNCGRSVTLKLTWIPSGTFIMGSPQDENGHKSSESPQHRVTFTHGFYMGTHEITQAQWSAIMGNNPSIFKGDNLPVERVNWNECLEFCRKLSKQVGRTVRLPSEAEWEYSCRAGTTTSYSTGKLLNTDMANYDGRYATDAGLIGKYRHGPTAVGAFPPNAWGLYDMHGNVWEWCGDLYHDDYNGAPTDGTAWMQSGTSKEHVLRGGAWFTGERQCRSASRFLRRPGWLGAIGFRVVAQ